MRETDAALKSKYVNGYIKPFYIITYIKKEILSGEFKKE